MALLFLGLNPGLRLARGVHAHLGGLFRQESKLENCSAHLHIEWTITLSTIPFAAIRRKNSRVGRMIGAKRWHDGVDWSSGLTGRKT